MLALVRSGLSVVDEDTLAKRLRKSVAGVLLKCNFSSCEAKSISSIITIFPHFVSFAPRGAARLSSLRISCISRLEALDDVDSSRRFLAEAAIASA